MEKKNIFLEKKKKELETEGNIWRRFCGGEEKGRKYLEKKNIFCGGIGRGEKYLEKANICKWRRRERKSREIFGEGNCAPDQRKGEIFGRNTFSNIDSFGPRTKNPHGGAM